ncbi:MAG: LOG family protein [Candidatus Kerfeldbacteria bacterium]|nr:LOG family protein [Candidatus Kerfeldbacteria bacterium]
MSELFGTVPGVVIQEGQVKNTAGLVAVMKGVASGEAQVKADGLVVSVSGGGSLPQAHPICYEAQKLAAGVSSRGGVLVNGGENGGTMLAVTEAEPDITLGIACPYHELTHFGTKAIVNSYQTRKMLIAIMPVVVVFPGQVGTLDELITCIGWIKSLQKQNALPPQLWVHEYWWDVLELLHSKEAIQADVWDKIHQFQDVDAILSTIKTA